MAPGDLFFLYLLLTLFKYTVNSSFTGDAACLVLRCCQLGKLWLSKTQNDSLVAMHFKITE